MKNNINTKIGATLLSAAILAGTAVIPMTNAAALDASAKTSARIAAKPSMKISAHVQDLGWMDPVEAQEGNVVGTFWQSRRVEAMKFDLRSCPDVTLNIRAHIQDYGDRDFIVTAADYDKLVGTQWEAKRMEAVTITSNGLHEKGYKLQYRAHVQDYGWLDWVEEGQMGGTRWESKRVEAIETRIVPIEEVAMSTKLDYIKANELAITLNSDPSNYYYTLVAEDGTSVNVTVNDINKKTNQVKIGASLVANTKYTLTTKDASDREIDKRTFTYRVLNGVNAATIDAKGINAENVNSLEITVSTNGVDYVKRTVELTLEDSTTPTHKKVKVYGTVDAGLTSTIVRKDVSELKDGTITVSAKVYDEEGNVTESNLSNITKGVEPFKIADVKTERTSFATADVTYSNITASSQLESVHYLAKVKGTTAPTVEEVVSKGDTDTTGSISLTNLEQDKMYTVYIVTENKVGTLSGVITATVAKDTIADSLELVTDIKSNDDGTFSWKDNQTKTTGYIAQLVQNSQVVAEKTVSGKTVDFSKEIEEVAADNDVFSVYVIAVGDYETVNNSEKQTVNEKTLSIDQLGALTTMTLANVDASTLRINVAGSDSRANAYKIAVIKGVLDENKIVYDEDNTVYTTTTGVNVSWIDLNVANYADGSYKVIAYAAKGTAASDIKYLDSAKTEAIYTRATRKISNITSTATNNSIKVSFTPVKIDGFSVDYAYSVEKLNSNGTWTEVIASTALTDGTDLKTDKNNSSLKTFEFSNGLNADGQTTYNLVAGTTYRVNLVPTYTFTKTAGDYEVADDAKLTQVPYVANNLAGVTQVTTKAAPITATKYVVDDNDLQTSLKDHTAITVKDGLLTIDGTNELKGSNAADVKALIGKLTKGDTFELNADGSVKEIKINALQDKTKTISLGNSVKDADLTIVGVAGQQINVSGNIGEGSITLNEEGTFNLTGLVNDDNIIDASEASKAKNVLVSNGTKVKVNDTTVNDVLFTGTGNVLVSGNNSITVLSGASVTAITSSKDKTVIFEGTHSGTKSITANGNNNSNTITVKTSVDSSIAGLEVVSGKVNVVDAYIVAKPSITAGTIITDTVFTAENLTVTPVSGNVTITKASSKNYTVSGNAKVEYAAADKTVDATVNTKLDNDGVVIGDYKFTTNNQATYTVNDDGNIEIALSYGVLTIAPKPVAKP